MYKISIIERAAEKCGFILDDVKLRSHLVVRSKGFIPGHNFKVMWDGFGRCFAHKGKVRLENFDLPIQTVLEEQKLEDFNHVCRS